MDDSTMIVALVVAVLFAAIWIVAVINAPIPTLLITFFGVIMAGFLSTSGGGDGRE